MAPDINPWLRPRRDSPPDPHGKQAPAPATPELSGDSDHTAPTSVRAATRSASATTPTLRNEQPDDDTELVWFVSAHGGAGESTLAALHPTWRAAGQAWPVLDADPQRCVLVARSNLTGLTAAQRALRQWATPATRPAVQLLGLLVVADAPGKLPTPLRDLITLISGGAPQLWQLDWVEAWRTDPPTPANAPRSVRDLITTINQTAAAAGRP